VLERLLKEANVTIAKKHSKLALDPHLLTPEVTILSSWGLKNRSWDRPITAQYPPIVNYLLHICYFPPKKTYTVRLNSYVLHNTHQLLHNWLFILFYLIVGTHSYSLFFLSLFYYSLFFFLRLNYLLHICYFPPKKTYTVRLNSYVLHNTHQLLHNTHQL
jgi:hypothetical protein